MIVVDATAWVDFFIGAIRSDYAQRIVTEEVVCPAVVDFEFGSAMLRRERRGEINAGGARASMETFANMDFTRERSASDLVNAYDLVDNATYADALYLVMAQRYRCPVISGDEGMIECAKIHNIHYVDIRDRN